MRFPFSLLRAAMRPGLPARRPFGASSGDCHSWARMLSRLFQLIATLAPLAELVPTELAAGGQGKN